jgi:hypothetical protein
MKEGKAGDGSGPDIIRGTASKLACWECGKPRCPDRSYARTLPESQSQSLSPEPADSVPLGARTVSGTRAIVGEWQTSEELAHNRNTRKC